MLSLTTIPTRHHHARRRAASPRPRRPARGVEERAAAFTPLIDARAAGRLLGVPHTWLLAQARAGRVPHHRLGHYVRFNGDDLARWLEETRRGPLRAGEARR
jgi:excisionase family DNA binding protein